MGVYYFFEKYFLGFFIWWYWIRSREVFQYFWRRWLFWFSKLRVWPMLSNLFVPLYQDTSWAGRLIAFPIRLVWGLTGGFISLVFLILFAALFGIYLLLPLVPLVGIITWAL